MVCLANQRYSLQYWSGECAYTANMLDMLGWLYKLKLCTKYKVYMQIDFNKLNRVTMLRGGVQ